MMGRLNPNFQRTLGVGSLWVGFLAVALPIFLLVSLVHPDHA